MRRSQWGVKLDEERVMLTPQDRLTVIVIGGAIGLAGFVLIALNAGTWAAVGVFLAIYGNNLQRAAVEDRRATPTPEAS